MNDNEVQVRITGDATAVAPAIQQTKGEISGLNATLQALSAQFAGLSATISASMAQSAEATAEMAAEMKVLEAETEAESRSLREMALSAREGLESFVEMREAMMGIGELVMAAFAVEELVEFAKHMAEVAEQTKHTAEQFGMTIPEVQQLKGIADQTGISFETITKGMGLLDRGLVNAKGSTSAQAEAFKALGISIDDGRTQMEKMLVVADKFAAMDDGPKKAALAMLVFGRSGKEMIPILNLGAEGIEKLNDKTAEYGVVSADANEKGVLLAESINESKLAFDGVSNVLTDALAPVFTEIANSLNLVILGFIDSYKEGGIVADVFATIAGVVEVVGAVINGLAGIIKALWEGASQIFTEIGSIFADVFGVQIPTHAKATMFWYNELQNALIILKDGFVIAIDIIVGAIVFLIDELHLFAIQAKDALTLNWGAIDADWKAGTDRIATHVEQSAARIQAAMKEAGDAIAAGMKGETLKTGGGVAEPKGTKDFSPDLGAQHKEKAPKKEKDDVVQQLDAELTAKKLAWAMEQDAEGTAHAYSIQAEADYWKTILDRTDLSTKDRAAIETKYLAARAQLLKEQWTLEEDGYKASLDAANKDEAAKLALVQAHTETVKRMFGEESTEYAKAQDEEVKAQKAADAQIRTIEREHEAELAKRREDRIAEAEKDAATRVALGLETNAQMLAQERDFENQSFQIKLAELEREKAALGDHDPAGVAKLNAQLEALEQAHQDKLSDIDRKAILERFKVQSTAVNSTASLWGQNISKLLTLEQGFATTIGNLYKGMVGILSSALGSIIQNWLQQHLAALVIGKAENKLTNSAEILGYAAVAGSAAYASTAAIPIVGPELAPAAAIAAYAGALSFMPSAEGGWWQTTAGLANLHENEMVLPAWAATPLRSMLGGAANGNAPAAANDSSSGDVHLHLSALDAKSVKRFLIDNKHDVAAALRSAARDGARP